VAALSTVLLAASPSLFAKLATGKTHVVRSGPVETAVLHVDGVDCEACAVPIRKALTAQGGLDELKLDVKARTVTVSYEPAPGRLAAYLKAIDELGYTASVLELQRGQSP